MRRIYPGCDEFRRLNMSRRGFVHAGMLGTAGLTLSNLLRAEAQAKPGSAKRQNSVIILYQRGGPPQHETWDPKPNAPSEFRGEFNPIATSVPGIHICEHLPLSAKVMDKFAIIRSISHRKEDGGVDHSNGDQIVFTGKKYGPNESINAHPSIGSIVAKQLQHQNPSLPAYVMIPKMIPGTGSAYLGSKCLPFETGVDPANPGPFALPNFTLTEGLTVNRLTDRRGLVEGLDRVRREMDANGEIQAVDDFTRQAWDILGSDAARKAFDLDAEPAALRNRYGFTTQFRSRVRAGGDAPGWTQRVLLARRLVEAGVRLVTVDLRWWDTHEDNFWSMKECFLPRFDQCYSALIEDLHQRGMLDTTMVLAWGEHGRTPRINAAAGRDHWGNLMSIAMAGGGIKGGRVVGASDAKGAEPVDAMKIPHDVLATLYRHLGVDTTVDYLDHQGRPFPVLSHGAPIDELFV
ncbi:MAG: hypothetical protein RLZZ265_2845 [Verrucomicrobiota bacterium]|jgi:Protein of unknown function (DUF1501)